MDHLFLAGGIILLIFFIFNYIAQRFNFPPLLAYLFLGVALAGLFTEPEQNVIEQIANMGIVLLFFLLGLHFPLSRLVNISRRIWQAGVLDVVLCFGGSFFLAVLFGFDLLPALIIGGVAYASSSSITVKMMEETNRMTTPEGEFKLALLIFEDLVAPVMVSFLVGLSLQGEITAQAVAIIFAKVVLMTAASIIIAYFGFRKLDLFLKRYMTKDFIPLFAISIALIFAGIAYYLDLSKLLGAFLAGVMLSETGTSKELEHLISPIKDITLPFFFFWFGTSIAFGAGVIAPSLLMILIAWAFVGKIIVGFWGGRIYGLTFGGSLRAAFSLGQRGEFSVVIAALADTALRVFLGIYIVITAIVGVYLFRRAPAISEKVARLMKKT
ncbi:cation:proton antiporter [Dethiobacter alkaliphilus]|uniref:Sodium/hydrogen exchanger n=1 Tax=Dethiobacter alkaliphilus AHT 1 TaxID=555088 RepID=C0GHH5_DETAL|nr:cation:proton antiporter [Dethiobacter alkaliphilus]EEG77181.1 sodium/hydrogen exchanger [Dethiobacter alkaliphilus AHT 1]